MWNPVTGAFFLGDDANEAAQNLTGHFPDSQDQRNTVRGRALSNRSTILVLRGSAVRHGAPFRV